MDWLSFKTWLKKRLMPCLTPTAPTPSKPKAADSVTGFVKTERELLLLFIKENLSFNSGHSWLGNRLSRRFHLD